MNIYRDVELFWKQQAALYGSTFHIDFSEKVQSPPGRPDVFSLASVERDIHTCTACSLSSARQGIVTGFGNPQARVICISSEPPAGPFVLEVEQDALFCKILSAIGFDRNEVYLISALKCRPNAGQIPEESAFQACSDHLFAQIRAIGPKLMLVLGEKAVQILSGRPDQLESFRGKEHHFAGISAFATYHPAQLLVNTSLKHGAWNDVQLLRRKYDELVGDKPSLA